MSKVTKWDTSPVPKRGSGATNIFHRTIPTDLVRQMRLTPGTLYRLLGESGEPVEFTMSDVNALVTTAKPFRVVSRQVAGDKDRRHVWIGYDPAHTEQLKQRGKRSSDE